MKHDEVEMQETRERLLQAGGEIFSRCGFRAATIRQISECAKANVAAVNYHFGDKRGLYAAVLKSSLTSALRKYPPDLGVTEGSTAEEKLRAFVHSFLLRILDDGMPAWHGRLMAHEIAEPTEALDQLVEEAMRPLYRYLVSILREILGEGAEEELTRLCSMSIIGQCLFYHHARPVIARLHQREYGLPDIERLTEHITQFSVHALKAFSREGRSQ